MLHNFLQTLVSGGSIFEEEIKSGRIENQGKGEVIF